MNTKEIEELNKKLKLSEEAHEAKMAISGLKSFQILLLKEHLAMKKVYDTDMTFFDNLTNEDLKGIISDEHKEEFSDTIDELKTCMDNLTKERAECYYMLHAMYSHLLDN